MSQVIHKPIMILILETIGDTLIPNDRTAVVTIAIAACSAVGDLIPTGPAITMISLFTKLRKNGIACTLAHGVSKSDNGC